MSEPFLPSSPLALHLSMFMCVCTYDCMVHSWNVLERVCTICAECTVCTNVSKCFCDCSPVCMSVYLSLVVLPSVCLSLPSISFSLSVFFVSCFLVSSVFLSLSFFSFLCR